jgi:type II secretion system protein G
MRKLSKKAFTLVEILIVVVILGILAAIVVPQFTNATQDAQTGNIRAQVKSLNNQVELFRARTNAYPDFATNGWQQMIDQNYIKTAPKNPYNNSTTIGADAAADGWHWYDSNADGTADSIGASNYDEVNDVLTPGVL